MIKRRLVGIRLPEELCQQLRLTAATSLRSIQNIVECALISYLSYNTLSDIPNPFKKTLDKSE